LFIDEMLDEIQRERYFSKLHLIFGYYHIRLILEDVAKASFETHEGHYEFKVMPFGITNALATFQVTMKELFHPYLWKHVLDLFDDILVYSKTWEEHMKHLGQVLSLLEENQFYAKMSKCTFWQGASRVPWSHHIQKRSQGRPQENQGNHKMA
jgi:hypothetical protein